MMLKNRSGNRPCDLLYQSWANPEVGITEEDVDKAVRLLNN